MPDPTCLRSLFTPDCPPPRVSTVDPECRGEETNYSRPEDAFPDGYIMKMKYVLPDIECEHCVLQMVYCEC